MTSQKEHPGRGEPTRAQRRRGRDISTHSIPCHAPEHNTHFYLAELARRQGDRRAYVGHRRAGLLLQAARYARRSQ